MSQEEEDATQRLQMAQGLAEVCGMASGNLCDYCNREAVTECAECEASLCLECSREHKCPTMGGGNPEPEEGGEQRYPMA